MNKVSEIITQEFVDALQDAIDNGKELPWRKTWADCGGFPKNAKSKKGYSGVNVWLLLLKSHKLGFKSPYWATFNQISELGGSVKAGSKHTKVILFKWGEFKLDITEAKSTAGWTPQEIAQRYKIKKYPLLRYFRVWNLEQTEGVDMNKFEVDTEKPNDAIEIAESIIKGYKEAPKILSGEPAYVPADDVIRVPNIKKFDSSESYYATLFHEMAHSTGHPSRLDRDGVANFDKFGSEKYGMEELIAEMGASFMNNESGIIDKTRDNSVAYIKGWLKALQNDPGMVIIAAGKAQKAVNFITNKKSEF